MIVYPAEYNRRKDSAFASVATAGGGGRRLALIPLSLRAFPETEARARTALRRAKKQPATAFGRWLKLWLLRAQYNGARRFFARRPSDIALCWNGLTGSRMAYMEGAADAGAARLFMELSPLPNRITLDPKGVNAENALPRAPGHYLEWAAKNPGAIDESWRKAGVGLVARPSRRNDVGQGDGANLSDSPFLFVPLQVPEDSQIRLFAGWAGDVAGFIAALADAATALPDGWHLRLKEHPSARTSLAESLASAVARAGGRIRVDNVSDTFAQVAASQGVVTINSSVGLQAFFHDKPVIVTGEAFFALPGLVEPARSADELAAIFARAETLGFDKALRTAFMSYLLQVYYPTTSESDSKLTVEPEAVRRKIAEARSLALALAREMPTRTTRG